MLQIHRLGLGRREGQTAGWQWFAEGLVCEVVAPWRPALMQRHPQRVVGPHPDRILPSPDDFH